MKKLLSIFCISLLIFITSFPVALAAPTAKQVKTFELLEFQVKQIKNGQTYILAFDAFVKKYWNDRTYLRNLKTNVEKVISSSSIKNKNTLTILAYLNAKIGIVLESNLTPSYSRGNSNTSSNNNNNNSTSTGSTTGTGTDTGTGSEINIPKPINNILTKEQYDAMRYYIYSLGVNSGAYSFFEYADLSSSASAKIHNDDTITKMIDQYGLIMEYHFLHFPLSNNENSQMLAEVAECLGYQKGGKAFFNFTNEIFREQKYDKEFAVNKAVSLGADITKLNQCLDTGFFTQKIKNQKALGDTLFSINEVPMVVIRNNTTGRYTTLKGSYSLIDYQKALESLYK